MNTNESSANLQSQVAAAPAAPIATPQPAAPAPVAAVNVTPAPVAKPATGKQRKAGKKNKLPAVTAAL